MKKHTLPPLPPPIPLFKSQNSGGSRCNWNRIAQDCARNVKRFLRKNKVQAQMDMSDALLNRRIQAVIGCTDRIIERYKAIPGCEEEYKEDTGWTWINLNLLSVVTYNTIEETSYVLFAAAIWILDQITCQPDWQRRLFPLLPRDEALLDDLYGPDAWDTSYEYELILSVMYVLYYRNIDIAPMETDGDGAERVLTTSLNARGEQKADVPSRNAFEALMDLIPQAAVEKAVQDFETLMWAWTDRYFSCAASLNTAVRDAAKRIEQLAHQYNDTREELVKALDAVESERNKRLLKTKQNKPAAGPLQIEPGIGMADLLSALGPARPLSGISPPPMGQMFGSEQLQRVLRLFGELNDISDKHNEAVDEHNDLERARVSFALSMQRRGYIRPEECERKYGKDAAAAMKPLRISDPYEICFALLWLIESGSDLPWLYGPGCGLMQEVSDSLPWGIIEYDEWDDPVWHPEVGDDSEMSLPAPAKRSAAVSPSPIPDWYERKYTPKDEDEMFTFDRSLAQIVYEETGCIMPRDLHRYDARLRAVKRYGVRGKTDTNMLLHLFSALSCARRQHAAANLDQDLMSIAGYDEDLGSDHDTASEKPDRALTLEELREQLKLLRDENKRLRSSLHESEHSSRETRKELASVRNAAELERRELADLRELVFNQETEAENEQPAAPVDHSLFPYEVKKNTIVFGGHETWLKAIRPMLTGNIRFIDKDMKNFDVGIIRNADKLWIQPNALSHNQYYRIVDAARSYRKPVRYFTYASAAKGAEQLMTADQ